MCKTYLKQKIFSHTQMGLPTIVCIVQHLKHTKQKQIYVVLLHIKITFFFFK